jgi:hypothetical protein
VPDAGLSYRSGLGLNYEIEHYQPPAPGPSTSRLLSPLLLPLSSSPMRNLPQKPSPAVFAPFYPSYVQAAINPGFSQTSTALSSQVSLAPPSPPPLGDWPRHNVTSLPVRGKRKQNLPYSFTMPSAAQRPRTRPSGPR